MLMNGKNVPISLYVLRPNIRFRMGGMVVAVGGEETGFTVIGNSNFQLSDEATTKTALGHYTTYFRPIIHTERNVMVCPDAVFQGYVAGGGSKMCELKDYTIDKRASEPARLKDLIVMPAALDDPMDGVVPLMGNFEKLSDTFTALRDMTSGNSKETKRVFDLFADQFGKTKLANAKFYGTRNDTNSMEGMDSMDMVGYNERYSGHNVLCFQGRQRGYKVTGVSGASMLGDFCNEVEGRGHLAGIEFTDSSIREFTGDISFRDDPNVRLAAAY